MARKILLVLMLIAALLCTTAFAESAYAPGEITRQLFKEAFDAGKMIKADIHLKLTPTENANGLSAKDAAALEALNNASFTLGAGKIENGLRVELAAQYGEGAAVTADAALNITYDGLLAQTSLLPGESVSAKWETLLALCNVPQGDIDSIMALRDADIEQLMAQALESIAPFIELAASTLAPYGQTIANFAASLPMEFNENIPAEGSFPAAAREMIVAITLEDVGALIIQLCDQLEADPVLSAFINGMLSQQSDLPASTTAELCALIRQFAAALTDTKHPLYLYLGFDAAGMPLYLSGAVNFPETGLSYYASLICANGEFMLDAGVSDAEGNFTDGLSLYLSYVADPDNSQVVDVSGQLGLFEDTVPFFAVIGAYSNAAKTTADAQPGYDGAISLAMEFSTDGEYTSVAYDTTISSAKTAIGGETMNANGSLMLDADGETVTFPMSLEMTTSPSSNGPTIVYKEKTSIGYMDTIGMHTEEHVTFYTAAYDPASTAALTATVLESVSSTDMEALVGRLQQNAEALVNQLMPLLPAELMETTEAAATVAP